MGELEVRNGHDETCESFKASAMSQSLPDETVRSLVSEAITPDSFTYPNHTERPISPPGPSTSLHFSPNHSSLSNSSPHPTLHTHYTPYHPNTSGEVRRYVEEEWQGRASPPLADRSMESSIHLRLQPHLMESRPISEASSSCSTEVTYRVSRTSRSQRPLTRYLPIKSMGQFNLRQHIESAGHQIELCSSVFLTPSTCRGFLQKMANPSRIFTRRNWNKRWFVFDRTERALLYYTDKSEGKPRGYIPFEDIEEVYVDHMRLPKSGSSSLKFIVKTKHRLLNLMACTPPAMRIWVEVIFTGAEGYATYD